VAQDFFELAGGGVKSFRVRRVQLSTNKTSSEFLRVTLNRYTGSPTSGSGGSTPAEHPLSTLYGTASVNAEANNTTRISGGTKVTLQNFLWNILTPFEWAPLDGHSMGEVAGDDHFTVGLEAAPAAATNMSGTIEWEEIG
jgi:hypothetical protein